MTAHIVFHRVDYDGYFGAAILASWCRERDEKYKLIPYQYGDAWSIEKHGIECSDTVMFVDCSLSPFSQMIELEVHLEAPMIILDHHATLIKDVTECTLNHYGILDATRSGCELAWNYCYGEGPISKMVYYCGRYDVWDKEHVRWNSHIKPLQLGLRAICPVDVAKEGWEIELWDDMNSKSSFAEALTAGCTIENYVKNENRNHAAKSFVATLNTQQGPMRCLVCNTQVKGSLFFESVWDESKHDIMLPYSTGVDEAGRYSVSFSMYTTKPEISCGEICKEYGGGGHRGAAGCKVEIFSCLKGLTDAGLYLHIREKQWD